VAGEIVDDDDIARLQSGRQNLLDIGKKAAAIDGAVDDARRIDSIAAQGGKEGHCPPVTIGALASSLSPLAHQPWVRVMLVLAQVSSIKTRCDASSLLWYFFHCSRRLATSGRSCSEACKLFF